MEEMSFKELLDEERKIGEKVGRPEDMSIELAAERYANRRNKTCDALILGFFSLLKGKTHDELERGDIVEEYQTYFGITDQREGKI